MTASTRIAKNVPQAIGNLTSRHIFYLPNPPLLPSPQLTVDALIELNGNHWRKILTITAKLMCGADDWKTYRDNQLLNDVCFNFGDRLKQQKSNCHYICGKNHWTKFALSPTSEEYEQCDEAQKAWKKRGQDNDEGLLLLLPYPDYRQFNNKLIDSIKTAYLGKRSLCI